MVIPVSYAALREATRERERGRGGVQDRADAPGDGRRWPWRRARGNSVFSPPPRGTFI
jgi:hypothetical protein